MLTPPFTGEVTLTVNLISRILGCVCACVCVCVLRD